MKNILIILTILIIIAVILAVGVYSALNQEWITEHVVRNVFRSQVHDMTLDRFTIDAQTFNTVGAFSIENLSCVLRDTIDQHTILINRIAVSSLYPLLRLPRAGNKINVTIKNANVRDSLLRITEANIIANMLVKHASMTSAEGSVTIVDAVYDGWHSRDISFLIRTIENEILINKINADFYGGSLIGAIRIAPLDSGAYTIDLTLTNVDIAELCVDKPDMFSQIDGTADITIQLTGTADEIIGITASADVVKDSSIDASLISPLLQYLPNSVQRKEIELLIKGNKKIPLDTTILEVKNTNRETVSAAIQLKSKKYNMDINLTVDFHVDGGLINLMTLFNQQIQQDNGKKG